MKNEFLNFISNSNEFDEEDNISDVFQDIMSLFDEISDTNEMANYHDVYYSCTCNE